ncbi:alpha/beta hydrolase [Kitasatospora sp. NPDC096140]|uniref:alpha/beta fold hydrolase n=1 Tax=Kitasatospora sp. NPDC096140 TaxID=3155425 RepID=UPI00332736EC
MAETTKKTEPTDRTDRTDRTTRTTRTTRTEPRPLPELPGVRHHFVEGADGVRLHLAEAGPGDGTPLLLLHGFPQHWYAWRHLLPLLDGEFRLLCADLPGFGWSSAPRRTGYTTDDRARLVLSVLDRLGLERVGLVGHDWGAWTGFELALRAPERFTGLLALNMTHPWPRQRALLGTAWRFWYTALLEYPGIGRRVVRRHPGLLGHLLRRGVAPGTPWSEAESAEYVAAGSTPDAAYAAERLHWGFVVRDIPRLALGRYRHRRLTVPTWLLGGALDPVIRPALLSAAGAPADDLTAEVLPGCGHFLPHERPEEVAGAVRRLFAAGVRP